MKELSVVLTVAGVVSLLYFIICIGCAGLGSTFSFVWLALSCVCFAGSMGLRYLYVHGIVIPFGIKVAALGIFVLLLAVFAYVEVLIISSSHEKPEGDVDYLIVLGAKIDGTRVSKSLASRLNCAYEYLIEHKDTKVVVSGGQGSDELVTEAEAMKKYLMEKGIEEGRILMEDQSTNTDQNIAYSRKIIGDDAASIAIVTNSFHLYRAMKIGQKQGLIHVTGIAAPTDKFLAVSYYVREGLAVLSYKFRGRI